jgi:uncharacterized protein (TIGR03118 family)
MREDRKMRNLFHGAFAVVLVAGALSLGALPAESAGFVQTNLVSDLPKVAAIRDPLLVNPWGVSHGPGFPFWVSNQLTNTTTFYIVTDTTKVSKAGTVKIPKTATPTQGPTGQVFNGNPSSFPVKHGGDGGPALFIFADFNGTISAWDPGAGSTAFIQVATRGAVYTGLAINAAQTRLYAADTMGGRVDVFDRDFRPLRLGIGAFVDPSLPKGLAPFNVQEIHGDIYVIYAPRGVLFQIRAPLGAGAVAIFDQDGKFIKQLIAGSRLAAPWGIALAPASFGRFGTDLLVGNFSCLHSEINAFNPKTGKLVGTLPVSAGGMAAGGLWSIGFGTGGDNGSPDTLYFADGINCQTDGLFGAISSQ